ncbi:MAG: CotH kinase family protein [Planctomycetota bacterium]
MDGKVYTDVGVRYRGNSSYNAVTSIKKPFKIKLNQFVSGQDLYGYSTLNLNNGFRDPTFVREVLSFWVFRKYLPAPKANWVKLIINNQSYGVYINVQQINADLLEEWFRSSGGNRYRAERGVGGNSNSPALTWLGSIASNYTQGYELKTENPTNPWNDIMQLCNVLNNTAQAQLPTALPKVLDVDESLRYLAANNLLPAVDSYIGRTAHNYYVYFDTYHGRAVLMPWDLNASFGGNAWLTVTQKQVLSPFYMMGITRPLLNNVVNTTVKGGEWRARYLAHLRTMVNQVYDWKVLGPKVTAYQNLIAAEVQRDSVKLYSNTLFTQNVTQDVLIRVRFSNQWIPGLKPMVDNRRAYLLNHAEIRTAPPVLSGLQHLPTQPTTTDTVWVTVKASTTVAADKVQLYHRVRGAYTEAPMFDDGKHQDGGVGDGIFGASIPKQGYGAAVDYYVSARAKPVSGGAMAFLPDTAAHQPRRYRVLGAFQPLAVVRINEVLADNDNGDRDEGGDRDDWVELINTGTTTYHLSGHYLTDDLNSPKAWQFPQGTTIPAGGFLRIWCDNEPTEGKLHATFKLGKNGEDVGLFDTDVRSNRMLDAVIFEQQKGDRSFGRLPDGSGSFFYLWTPSGNLPATGTGSGRTLRFDTRRTGAPSGFDLKSSTSPFTLDLSGGNQGPAALGISPAVRSFPLGPLGTLLVDASAMVVVFLPLDATGAGKLTATVPNAAVGVTVHAQALQQELSNGIAIRVSR